MLNKIILSLINQSQAPQPDAMSSDAFENPRTYKGWIYPLRYLLSLRYLKQKQKVLKDFRENKTYPITADEFKQALIKQLSGNKKSALAANTDKKPVTSFLLKSSLVYPVLLAALGFGIYSLNDWYQQRRIENVLANHLPYYSDLLHRKLVLKHNDNAAALLKTVDASLESEQKKILSDLPEANGIRAIIEKQLEKLKNASTDSEEIMLGFKDVNTLFDQHKLPYYLSPKSFTMPCSSLIDAPVEQMMMLKKLEALMSNNNPELCRTTMMTAYKVKDRKQLFYVENNNTTEFPLFRVARIDKVPAVDSALGLTFKDRGIGSIILIDRIKDFARESILPALTFQGRNYIIPYWMQGYYEIEEAVTKGYKKDLNAIYPDKTEQRKVKVAIKKLISDKYRMQNSKMQQTMQRTNSNSDKSVFGNGFDAISVLFGKEIDKESTTKRKVASNKTATKDENVSLEKLDAVLLPSIEYHEAYHQIDKKKWKSPAWITSTFKDKLSEDGIDHTLEELGAYLAQLANTKQGQNIWLSKLLIFSLNPMTKGQAEYYASSIILTTLESLYLDKPIEPNYIATVEEKTRIYKTLLTKDNIEISSLAKKAYETLFERGVPILRKW
jgi:hypothetical protein